MERGGNHKAVLVKVSIAVKRDHDQSNSYKGQHLIRAELHVQRFSPLSLCQGGMAASRHAWDWRHIESSIFRSEGS